MSQENFKLSALGASEMKPSVSPCSGAVPSHDRPWSRQPFLIHDLQPPLKCAALWLAACVWISLGKPPALLLSSGSLSCPLLLSALQEDCGPWRRGPGGYPPGGDPAQGLRGQASTWSCTWLTMPPLGSSLPLTAMSRGPPAGCGSDFWDQLIEASTGRCSSHAGVARRGLSGI